MSISTVAQLPASYKSPAKPACLRVLSRRPRPAARGEEVLHALHFKSLLHVRDHAKVRGTAHHLLEYIALHVNRHTGEAFDLTVERLAHRLDVTLQWVGQLRARLVQAGELIVQQSRGRHPNVYRIPYERCPACQGANPKLEHRDDVNPKVPSSQPQRRGPATPKWKGGQSPIWPGSNL